MKTAYDFLKSNGMISERESGGIAVLHFSNYLGLVNVMNEYAIYYSNNENTHLKEKISELNMYLENRQDKVAELETDMKTAVTLLQTCIHDNLPIIEAIDFVQSYWNKHNIFPYEP